MKDLKHDVSGSNNFIKRHFLIAVLTSDVVNVVYAFWGCRDLCCNLCLCFSVS